MGCEYPRENFDWADGHHKEDHLHSRKWPLGRIVSLHPGSDGIIRVASVRLENGVTKHPVSKLCLLPGEYADLLKDVPSFKAGSMSGNGHAIGEGTKQERAN